MKDEKTQDIIASDLNALVMVIVVNHGNVFGHGNWYTFYCPKCNAQVYDKNMFCKCGQRLGWKES